MKPSILQRLVMIAVIAGLALVIWIPRQSRLARARKDVVQRENQLAAVQERMADVRAELDSVNRHLLAQREDRNRALAEFAAAQSALAKVRPETRWASPPDVLPAWEPESPFVWVRKEMASRIPASPFDDFGRISAEAAFVMAVDAPMLRAMNERLSGLIAEYRKVEAAKAEPASEHLPGIANGPGEKFTIRVQPLPEEGARIKTQFQNTLVEALGEQRANLLMAIGESWLDENLRVSERYPKPSP